MKTEKKTIEKAEREIEKNIKKEYGCDVSVKIDIIEKEKRDQKRKEE